MLLTVGGRMNKTKVLVIGIGAIAALGLVLVVGIALVREKPIGQHMAIVYRLSPEAGAVTPDDLATGFRCVVRTWNLRIAQTGSDSIEVQVPLESNVPVVSLGFVNILLSRGWAVEMRIAPSLQELGATPAPGPVLSAEQTKYYLDLLGGRAPGAPPPASGSFRWFPVSRNYSDSPASLARGESDGNVFLLLCDDPSVCLIAPAGRTWIENAAPGADDRAKPAIHFELTDDGAARMAALTGANLECSLAILVGGEVYSVPVIKGRVSKRGTITGVFTAREAKDLALLMGVPPLPARVLLPPVSVTYKVK